MEWYYILGIISYGIFIIQFILSCFGTDSDVDIDLDGDSDFDLSSLFSFKGLIHFIMGFSGWLMINGNIQTIDIYIAVVVGIIFMVLLYYLYRMCMKFNHTPIVKVGNQLIGQSVYVYLSYGDSTTYIGLLPDNREIICRSATHLSIGRTAVIESFNNGIYFIS